MTAGRCKGAGCREACVGTRCEVCRVKFNEKEKRGGERRKRDTVEGQCTKCFQHGHDEAACRWKPSIFASYETPWEAARRIGA